MKNKRTALFLPLLVSVIFLLIPISEKLLLLTLNSNTDILLSASGVQLFIFAIPTAFYCKMRGVNFLSHAKLNKIQLSDIPFTLYAGLTYFLSAVILLYIEFNLFNVTGTANALPSADGYDFWGIAFAYVIVPAIAEELFFRSVILSEYSEFKPVSAIVISALFFAMLHFSFALLPLYFILGLILAGITYVTNTSLPAVIIHLLSNTLLIFFEDSVNTFFRESSSSILLIFILAVAFLVSLILTLSSMEEIYEKRSVLYAQGKLPGSRRDAVNQMSKAGKVEASEEKNSSPRLSVFLSPTFLLSILIFVLITLDVI